MCLRHSALLRFHLFALYRRNSDKIEHIFSNFGFFLFAAIVCSEFLRVAPGAPPTIKKLTMDSHFTHRFSEILLNGIYLQFIVRFTRILQTRRRFFVYLHRVLEPTHLAKQSMTQKYSYSFFDYREMGSNLIKNNIYMRNVRHPLELNCIELKKKHETAAPCDAINSLQM